MWFVPIILIVLLASGLGLAYVVGGAAVVSFILTDNERYLAILPQKVFSQISVFALLSMPLFILAGELMNRGGVTKALIDFSMALVGRIRGGLGHVNIMTSVFFAGISGSAVADAASLVEYAGPGDGATWLYQALCRCHHRRLIHHRANRAAVDHPDLLRRDHASSVIRSFFCLIICSCLSNDKQKSLPYAITPICPLGADGEHNDANIAFAYGDATNLDAKQVIQFQKKVFKINRANRG